MDLDYFTRVVYSVALIFGLTALVGCSEDGRSSGAQITVTQEPTVETFEWKMVTSWPKNLPGLGIAPENLANHVDKMSAGRLKIKVYGAGELVQALEVFDTVSNGAAEMGHTAAYYWQGKVPEAAFFATVPFGMNAMEMNSWIHHGGGLELWRELYEPFNLIPFAAGNSGVQMAGWFNKEINSLEDFQGLKMRIPGLGGKVFGDVGGVPDNLPGPEIYTSLQTGVIDATEWVGPVNDLAFALYDIADFYYYPGWHEPGTTLELLVNRTAWESLPEDLQHIVTVATRAVNHDMLDSYTADNYVALQTLLNDHKVDLRKLPEDVLKSLYVESMNTMRNFADPNDELAQRIVDSYIGFMENVRQYNEITEIAYNEARAVGKSED